MMKRLILGMVASLLVAFPALGQLPPSGGLVVGNGSTTGTPVQGGTSTDCLTVGSANKLTQAVCGGAPSGAAGGDLGGTYPNPTVVSVADVTTGVLLGANGGTGIANTGKTITLGGNLTTSGAFASTFTMTNTTSVTFPVSGTLATTTNLASYLPLAGGTMTGGIGFSTTNTLDIGTSATVLAPRTVYAGTSFVGPVGTFTTSSSIAVATGTSLALGGATISSNALAVTGAAQFNGAITQANSQSFSIGSGGMVIAGRIGFNQAATGDIVTNSAGRIGFVASTDPTAAPDTYFIRFGAGVMQSNGAFYANAATPFGTKTTATNGAAASVGTLTNAPAAGNPTKWVPFDDNGTTRYVPMW